MNRLLIWEHERDDSGRVTIEGERARHLREVLRAEKGDSLRAGIINGPCAKAVVLSIGDTRCELEVWVDEDTVPLPPPKVDLVLAMPRPKFLQRLLPQLATLGIRNLYLIPARRVERFYFDTHILKPEHYRPLILLGLEQSTDTHFPELHIVRPPWRFLRDELAPRYAEGHRILAHPGERTGRAAIPATTQPLLLAIGPEGGWTGEELERFEEMEFTRFSLGRRVLRTDMACVAMLTLLDYLRPEPESETPTGL